MKKSSWLALTLATSILFLAVFGGYVYEALKYQNIYVNYALNQNIDITHPNAEYKFQFSHPYSSDDYVLRLDLIVPRSYINTGKTWSELTQEANFKIQLLLKNAARDIVNETVMFEKGGHPTFYVQKYSHKETDDSNYELDVKVISPQDDTALSKVRITARGLSKTGQVARDLYLLGSLLLGLLVVILLKYQRHIHEL